MVLTGKYNPAGRLERLEGKAIGTNYSLACVYNIHEL